MRVESFRHEPNGVEFAAIILSRGEIVSATPGAYELRLLGPNREEISNRLTLMVKSPSTAGDLAAVNTIKRNPAAYGLFVYLKGGDHLVEGLEIVSELAQGSSSYSDFCRLILAMNYSQRSYDWTNDRIRREKDANRALYFAREASLNSQSPYLQLSFASMIQSQFQEYQLPAELKATLISIKSSFENSDAAASSLYRGL
jgi:hypothetical protein